MKTRINWFCQHLPEAKQVTDVTIKTAECGTSGEIGNLFWRLMQLSLVHTEQLFANQPVNLFWSGSIYVEMGIQSLQRKRLWRCICVHYCSAHIPLCPSLTFLAPKAQTQQSQTRSSHFYNLQFPVLFFNPSSPLWPLLFTSSLLNVQPALYPARVWTQTRRKTNYKPWHTEHTHWAHMHSHSLLFCCPALLVVPTSSDWLVFFFFFNRDWYWRC